MKEACQLADNSLLPLNKARQFLYPFHFALVSLLELEVLFDHVHLLLLEYVHNVLSLQLKEVHASFALLLP